MLYREMFTRANYLLKSDRLKGNAEKIRLKITLRLVLEIEIFNKNNSSQSDIKAIEKTTFDRKLR